MTYCVGVRYGESVYLMADSAITGGPKSSTQKHTSFGEPVYKTADLSVSERALKLIEIAGGFMVAVAGNFRRALNAVEVLRVAFQPDAAIPALVEQMWLSLESPGAPHFEILLARHGSFGAELWKWSSAEPSDCTQVPEIAEIGSMGPWHISLTRAIHETLAKTRIPEEHLPSALAAAVQSYGLRNRMIRQGVGGFVVAARISSAGISWLPDTNYLVCNPGCTSIKIVGVLCRDKAVAVSSSYTKDIRVFLSGVDKEMIDEWQKKWRGEVVSQFSAAAARYWVFLRRDQPEVFVIYDQQPVSEIPCCKIVLKSPGRYVVSILGALRLALTRTITVPAGAQFFFMTVTPSDKCIERANWLAMIPTETAEKLRSAGKITRQEG
jgi:hypothetical protein